MALSNWSASVVLRLPPPPSSPLRAIPSPPASVIASFFWSDTTRRALSSFRPPSVLLPFNPARDDADDIPPPPRSFHAIVRVVLHPLLLLLQQQGQGCKEGSLAPPYVAARASPNPRRHSGPRIDPLASPSTGPSSTCARLLLPASSRRPSLLDFRGLPTKSS